MLLEAFLFGLTIAIAIGPIALLILNASISRGVMAGVACGAGAATADFTFALIAFGAGTGLLALLDAHREAIALAGALVLCALGAWLAITAWRNRNTGVSAAEARAPGFAVTYLLTMANPLTVLFFAAWLGSRPAGAAATNIPALALAVFAGSLLVQTGLAFAGGGLRRLLSPSLLTGANLASGVGIFAFGAVRLFAM